VVALAAGVAIVAALSVVMPEGLVGAILVVLELAGLAVMPEGPAAGSVVAAAAVMPEDSAAGSAVPSES
jgi:hypothetical protein